MLNKIARTLKPYYLLLLCVFMLIGSSPWPGSMPPLQEQPSDELVGTTTPETEPVDTPTETVVEPITENKTSSKDAASETKESIMKSVPEPQPATKIPQRVANERPVPQPEPDKTASTTVRQQDLNTYVLEATKAYTGGKYPYLLDTNYTTYNGVTSNIYYQGNLLLKAHPSGDRASHCVGITFEVFFKAMQARNKAAGLGADDFNGMSAAAMTDFMLKWYVAGPKGQNNLALAIEKYGLGQRITNLAAAKAGDFIDFSRTNGTGHAAVLINWLKQDGKIIGLRYWSSQESTGGIAYAEEYFAGGNSYGGIRRDQVYISRVGPIARYR